MFFTVRGTLKESRTFSTPVSRFRQYLSEEGVKKILTNINVYLVLSLPKAVAVALGFLAVICRLSIAASAFSVGLQKESKLRAGLERLKETLF